MLVLTVALIVPATASAQEVLAPPGNSAIDEYVETVPSADGPKHSLRPTPASGVSRATGGELKAYGADGQAVLELTQADGAPARTAPSKTSGKPGRGPSGSTRPSDDVADAVTGSSGSVVNAAVKAVAEPSPGGLGLLLPLMMAGTAAVGVAIAVRRSRRS
jgi:hypothetical protein